MKPSDNPYRVIVMGKTGSGKSSVLNSLTRGAHFDVGDSIMSRTQEVQVYRGKFRGRITSPDIVFVDTPGFFDSSAKDNTVIAKIALSLRKIEDGLNLVLFCFPAYEIRFDASLQASWRFLKLVMGKAVYEHVVIVLTHGNRMNPVEQESAITRMTREFIPYLKTNLKCKVKEEILIYRKGEENDGLEDVLKYITTNPKYQPKIMEDLGKFWDERDPLGSIEYLLQNSQIFKKIQDLLQEVQSKNEELEDQMEEIRVQMEKMATEKNNEIRLELDGIEKGVKGQFKEQHSEIEAMKQEIGENFRRMQMQLEDKDKQIVSLKRGMEELKHQPSAPLANVAKPMQRSPSHPVVHLDEKPSKPSKSRDEIKLGLDDYSQYKKDLEEVKSSKQAVQKPGTARNFSSNPSQKPTEILSARGDEVKKIPASKAEDAKHAKNLPPKEQYASKPYTQYPPPPLAKYSPPQLPSSKPQQAPQRAQVMSPSYQAGVAKPQAAYSKPSAYPGKPSSAAKREDIKPLPDSRYPSSKPNFKFLQPK